MKVIAENREAYFEYFVDEKYEVGISLDGGEVKSIRAGNVSLKDVYCSVYNGELFIKGMHVAVYDKGGAFNVKDSRRDRRLLMHKSEINRLIGKVKEKGFTIVPLKLYFKQSLIKVEVGLCRGKHTYDKKQSIKERDLDREAKRDIKDYSFKR
ncbi:MAG: SsrA-binding protein SmpB [Clostridia bacterium]|nr:SsrA-binding protein SmpB [Clostridia bacterium]MBR1676799.1 SsrA-binding protein SmpB [Clostridia bacterium]